MRSQNLPSGSQYSLSSFSMPVDTSEPSWPKPWGLPPHKVFPGPFLADFVKTERDESSGPKSLKSLTSHDPMKQWEPANR